MDTSSGKYLYCVFQGEDFQELEVPTIDNNSKAYTISYEDILAVVSDTDQFIFDPTQKNAMAHERVISEVMKENTVVPMSFGNVFKSEENITIFLQGIHEEVKSVLAEIEGKIELGLKIFWDPDDIAREVKEENPELANIGEASYQFQIRIGQKVAELVDEKRNYYSKEIMEGLNELAIASKKNRTIGDRMVLNAAFLIQREMEENFDTKVNELYEKFEDKLEFKYTGPWPPYNFVNIKLEIRGE